MNRKHARVPRLSATEALVLGLLLGEADMYGLELVAVSNGALKRGTVYVTLGRMEEKGFITSRQEEAAGGGLPRRLYRPTVFGRQVFEAWEMIRVRVAARYAR